MHLHVLFKMVSRDAGIDMTILNPDHHGVGSGGQGRQESGPAINASYADQEHTALQTCYL